MKRQALPGIASLMETRIGKYHTCLLLNVLLSQVAVALFIADDVEVRGDDRRRHLQVRVMRHCGNGNGCTLHHVKLGFSV
jgi:hypothetical protein